MHTLSTVDVIANEGVDFLHSFVRENAPQKLGPEPKRRGLFASTLACALAVSVCFVSACFELERVPEVTGAPECDAGDDSFVEQTTISLLGRRPLSHAEIDLGARAIAEQERLHPGEGRRRWALALMNQPAFIDRWSELLLDDLYVPRTGVQAMGACYGDALIAPEDEAKGDLALFVLDNTAVDDLYDQAFTFRDLVRQSLVVDDVSPVYRAHLYALLTRLNACGNVDPVAQELAFRDEVGHTFEAAYLNRDPVCLACHTTTFAVTDDDDPAVDRHWPLRGKFEDSVFGNATVDDPAVPRAVFRVDQFVNGGGGFVFPDLDGTAAFCFDQGTMSYTPSFCSGPPPDGTPLGCDGGFPPFCLSPFDEPTCTDDGNGGGRPTCANTPFCYDQFTGDVDATFCDGGIATCTGDPMDWFPICGDFFHQPLCGPDGVPFCVEEAAEGEGEGEEGEGEDKPVDDGTAFTPWGADPACGSFAKQVPEDDPADVDAHFASVKGRRATVLQLEQSLKRGVDALAVRGLLQNDEGDIANPDDAFAYLVAMNVVDNTWREVTGSGLTIATHFPRNQFQRDLLQDLSDRFVASHFSIKELLADVVTSDYVNLRAPVDGCSDADDDTEPFVFPPVFDPWRRDEPVEVERNNATSDAVHALSSRTLLSAAYAALGWPHPKAEAFPEGDVEQDFDFACFDMFPDCATLETACLEGQCCPEKDAACGIVTGPLTEVEIQRGIGVFHGISEKGFRGLDFQARLFFEARFGSCKKPDEFTGDDAIDDLVARAGHNGTVRDTVLALKERVAGDTSFDADEKALVEALFFPNGGSSLDVPADSVAGLDGKLRVLCGALLASPQFQLTGIAQRAGPPARLQPTTTELCKQGLPGCR